MRVLHIIITANMGGIERFIFNNYLYLKDKNVQFDCLSSDDVDYPIFQQEQGIRCIKIPSPRNIWQYVRSLHDIFQTGGYDVIHIHKNSLINSIPIYLVKLFTPKGTKIIIHAHNTAPKGAGKRMLLLHYLNRWILLRMKLIHLACSEQAAEFMFAKKQVILMYNGIDFDQFQRNNKVRETMRRKYSLTQENILLGDVAAMIPQKNLYYLIDIFYKLYQNDQRYRLMIVGDGPEHEEIEAYIRRYGLEDVVILTGSVPDVENYLSMMDIFVMPSLFEGLPISAIEAQVAGLPLVISANVDSMVQISQKCIKLPIDRKYTNQWINVIKKVNVKNFLMTEKAVKFNVQDSAKYLFTVYKGCGIL